MVEMSQVRSFGEVAASGDVQYMRVTRSTASSRLNGGPYLSISRSRSVADGGPPLPRKGNEPSGTPRSPVRRRPAAPKIESHRTHCRRRRRTRTPSLKRIPQVCRHHRRSAPTPLQNRSPGRRPRRKPYPSCSLQKANAQAHTQDVEGANSGLVRRRRSRCRLISDRIPRRKFIQLDPADSRIAA